MVTSAEKTYRPTTVARSTLTEGAGGSFLQTKGEEGFFAAGAREGSFFSPGPAFIQPKLEISQPGDKHEQEADAMAAQVMTMADPAPVAAARAVGAAGPGEEKEVHRKEEEGEFAGAGGYEGMMAAGAAGSFGSGVSVSSGGSGNSGGSVSSGGVIQTKEEKREDHDKVHAKLWLKIQRKEEDKKEKDCHCQENHRTPVVTIDREAISESTGAHIHSQNRGPPAGSPSFESSLNQTKGSGSSLPPATLQHMEGRFGADFSGVRIHTDSTAVSLSRDIHAQAFTHGSDIYFNTGKYAPHTSEGGFLLAHELTHTIQQGAVSRSVMPKGGGGAGMSGSGTIMPKVLRPFKSLSELQRDLRVTQRKADGEEYAHELGSSMVTEAGELTGAAGSAGGGGSAAVGGLATVGAGASTNIQAKAETKDTGQEEKTPEPEKQFMGPDSRVHAIDRREERGETAATVTVGQTGPGVVQRNWLGDAWDAVSSLGDLVAQGLEAGKRILLNQAKEVVSHIPGYRALGVVLGHDPITDEHIERNGHNFIEAAFDIMPGGEMLHRKLSELGALTDAERWVDEQIAAVENLVSNVRAQVTNFINDISLSSLAHPGDLLRRAGDIIVSVVSNVVNFAVRAGGELLSIVKRFLLTQIVNFVKTQTTAYPLLRVVLGKDPITDEEVARNGTNILNAILELSEEGREQRKQMHDTGTFQKVADWIDRGIAIFHGAYEQIVDGFHQIWGLVNIQSLMDPIGTFRQIYNIFAAPVGRVLNYMAETALMILRFIKDVLMRRLAEFAKTMRGYPLIRVILGKDPFTDEQVPRNVENLIHGFMSLMDGGEEQFQQMLQTGAIARAQARVDTAVARLGMTPAYVVGLFRDLWNSFHLSDLASPIETFRRIMARFGEPIGRLIAFVVEIVRIVIDVILQIMNFPTALIANIIARTQQAFQMIKADPIGFLKNLLRAIKQGFIQFFDKILQYLRDGLISWLMGELRDSGVAAPTDFSLRGIIGWVLTTLGITMENIWDRLARHPQIGPERVARIRSMINTLEGIWTFIKDVQERGIAAIWERIQQQLSNLWNTILDAVKSWIIDQIINRMVARLLSMLDPTGIMAVINSAMALYRAIQSFMRYLRQMLEIVNSFVEGVVEIASGNITVAANFLERTLGRAVPIIIGFLANQVGLSGIGRRIGEMIGAAREMVNHALDWLINQAVRLGGRLLEMGRNAAGAVLGWLGLRKPFTLANGESHEMYFENENPTARIIIASRDPKTLQEILSTKTWQGVTIPDDKLTIIGAESTSIDGKRANQGVNIGREIRDSFDRIVAVLNTVGGAPVPPTTLKTQSTRSSGAAQVGEEVWAEPLSVNPNGLVGTEPTVDSDMGTELKRRYPNAFVAGHLLNHNMHGPGNLRWNLTPLTIATNNAMKLKSENQAKAKVLSEGKVLSYRVKVNYKTSSIDPAAPTYPEGQMPDSLDITIKEMEFINGNWAAKATQPPWAAAASGNVPQVTSGITGFGGAPVVALSSTVDLNTAGRSELMRLGAIAGTKADAILNFRAIPANRLASGKFFDSVDDLSRVAGIGSAAVTSIKADIHITAVA